MEKDNTSVRSGEYIRVDYRDYATLSVRRLGLHIVVDELRSGSELKAE